jgi:hypothetical protein
MESKKRKRRSDRNHAIYKIVVGEEFYIGVTVVDGTVKTSLKRRLGKHWSRSRTDKARWGWKIYKALRRIEREEAHIELVEVVRGKVAAHKRERDLIKIEAPTLNSDVR